jgi:hypothetical protein
MIGSYDGILRRICKVDYDNITVVVLIMFLSFNIQLYVFRVKINI